jgi:polyisoprenoid-binding protein YceI
MTISYTRGGVTKTTTVTATVQQGGGTVYSITGSITNGSLTGDSSVAAGGSANVTISPSSGYTYPAAVSDITVTGATKGTYNSSTGALTITNATGNVTITAACPSSGAVIKTLAEIQASLKTAQC